MTVPRWDDPALKAGTMIKGALWLAAEVGEGGVFTKEQVRQAFPGISQADRRIRDLRDYGWVIHTNTDDASLASGEQRLVKIGTAVWDSNARREAAITTVSAKQRQATLAADNYQCSNCGIAGGEPYPEAPHQTAVLSVTLRTVALPDGTDAEQLVTLCKFCRAGTERSDRADIGRLLSDIRNLDKVDQDRIYRWIRRGHRGPTPLDRAWTTYRRMPTESKEQIIKDLGIS
ncbi:hypothetical protein E1218_02385 [Kribbella turkmenica]|uniref:HNH endonuclease n=1 Tax=Kribbella turkmenica TaxID=2530375 RepID=A0A4R4XGD3_9ACTN|nr:hypothetical protein [Kribbella turkmenica]TDD29998.1 hypothetical protein E1218_02385 [Kribbella turkmenica]